VIPLLKNPGYALVRGWAFSGFENNDLGIFFSRNILVDLGVREFFRIFRVAVRAYGDVIKEIPFSMKGTGRIWTRAEPPGKKTLWIMLWEEISYMIVE